MAELHQLSALLPLLRSGVLSQFFAEVQPMSSGRTSKAEKSSSVPTSPAANEGWKSVKAKKQTAPKEPPKSDVSAPVSSNMLVSDQLQSQGFNADVVPCMTALVREKACVCLASLSDARKAKGELSSALPMAVLSTQKLDGEGEEVCVLVKDKHGKLQSRVRFMIQHGAMPVTYNLGHVAKGAEIGDIRKQVVVFLEEQKSATDIWKQALSGPKTMVDRWLKDVVKVEKVGRIQEARLCDGLLSTVVAVPAGSVDAILKASGERGVCVSQNN